ncbi:hypothetical protein Q3G72_004932 [Acer saccharum]|nr:hypothetical protein Q3G72_004932 [Acer saccharum]
MGSAVLNKSPSSFIAFVYGFLLISFLLNIPHAQGAVRVYSGRSGSLGAPPATARHTSPPQGVKNGAPSPTARYISNCDCRVGAPPSRHDANAKQGSAPLKHTSTALNRNCDPRCGSSVNPWKNPKNGSPLYSWTGRRVTP